MFLAFASYLVQIITPVRLVSSMLATTQQARAGAERVFELLDLRAARRRRARRPAGRSTRTAAIELDHVSFGYADGPATAARHLADDPARRADRPRRRVRFGQDHAGLPDGPLLRPDAAGPCASTAPTCASFTLESLRSTVNVVFEESFLFSTTIRENIAFARPDASDAEIEAAARVAQAHDFILDLSHGYDTVVGERGFTLSGGQRQRIALARAALANPRVLILDDATSAIDARTEEAIHASLGDELAPRTTILIAHRSSTLRLADRVIVDRRRPHRRRGHQRRAVAHVGAVPRAARPGPTCPVADTDRRPASSRSDRRPTEAWPSQSARSDGDGRGDRRSRAWSTMFAGMASRRRRDARASAPAPGWSRRRPSCWRRVDALPPLRGDPDVDLAEATDRRTACAPALRRLLRRFRWALVGVGLLRRDRRRHHAGRSAADPPRARRRRRRSATATAVWRCASRSSPCSW